MASVPSLTWSLPSSVPTPWHSPVSTVTSPQIPWSGTVPLVPPLSLPQTAMSVSLGLSLSPDCEPIPAKLVEKSRAGQFIEMREFLPDNVKLVDKLESAQAAGFPSVYANPMHRPRLREVSTPLSWIHCFLAYVAVRTDDSKTRDMLTYARLVLGEAMAHGGIGWLEYDRAARQQRALDPTKAWNVLDIGLHSKLILGHSASGTGSQCIHCQGSDHTSTQCALAVFEPSQSVPSLHGGSSGPAGGYWVRGQPNRREPQSYICLSWNRGACSFPSNCIYRHICSSCRGRHKAKDCPASVDATESPRNGRRSPATSK